MAALRRAVVFRAGALGDLVLLRRAVASLRTAGFSVTVVAPAASGAALVGSDEQLAQTLVPWERADVARAFARGDAQAVPSLAGPFEAAIVYSRQAEIADALNAAAARIVVHDPMPPGDEHASVWLSRPMGTIGLAGVEPATLRPTAEEAAAANEAARRLPTGFLAIHPGSGSPRKNWPADRFAALVVRQTDGRPWLLVLGPAEDASLLASLPGAVVARGWPLRTLGAVLAHAGAYVGNDSGVSHWAAAWGAPVVALFGPTDPGVWAPLGPRVSIVQSSDGTIESIAVDSVLAAAATCGEPGPRSR